MNKISVVVPCYNEEETIKIFHKEFFNRTASMKQVDFELIFVNDGSKDKTIKKIKDVAKKDKRVKYISFSRNFGKEAAMYAGLKATTGDYVAIMDVDLQDPPEMLQEMYELIKKEKYDCVAARRFTRKGEPKLRSMFARMFYKLINKVSETEIVDGARDFRLMTRQMCNEILKLSEKNRFAKGLLNWVGFNTYWLKYENVERVAGSTKWNFWKLFKYAIEGIISFTVAPLNIPFVFMGLFAVTFVVFLMLSLINLSNVFFAFLYGIFSFISLFASLLLLCLGVIGLYLSRTYKEIKNRPIFVVKETNILGGVDNEK